MNHNISKTDSELLVMLKNNNPKAFTDIYNRYWDKLYVVAANKLGDLFQAQEIVQEIFLDLWRRREKLAVTENLNGYLATALKYKVINLRQKRTVEQKYVEHAKKSDVQAYSMENYLQFDELKAKLERLVAKLPEKCQMVYKLSREEGLSQKEIAQKLEITEKTVEAHLTRALKTLKSGLRYLLFFFW